MGSIAGGTQININGDGFIPQSTVVLIGQSPYYNNIANTVINYTHIVLTTTSSDIEVLGLSIKVLVNNVQAVCGNCVFDYSTSGKYAFSIMSYVVGWFAYKTYISIHEQIYLYYYFSLDWLLKFWDASDLPINLFS